MTRSSINTKILDLDSYRNLNDNSTRLLFIELLLLADEYGLLCASATFLRRATAAAASSTDAKIDAMLLELQAADLLKTYVIANQRYVYLRSDGVLPRSKRSKWPPPPNSAEFVAQFERSKPVAWSVRRYRHKHSQLIVNASVPDATPIAVLPALPCAMLTSMLAAAWADFDADVVTRGLLHSSAVRRSQKMIAAARPQDCANRYDVHNSIEQNQRLTEILHTGARSILQAQHNAPQHVDSPRIEQNQRLTEILHTGARSILQDAQCTKDAENSECVEQNQQVSQVIHRFLRTDTNLTNVAQLPLRAPASPARIYACASALIESSATTACSGKDFCSHGKVNVVGMGNTPRPEHQKNIDAGRESERGEDLGAIADAAPLCKRGSRLPASWVLPPELLDWTKSRYPDVPTAQIEIVAEDFADYWHAKAGPNAIKLSWPKTWYRWCRTKWGDGCADTGSASTTNKPQTFRQIDIADKRATMRAWMGKFQLPTILACDKDDAPGVQPKLFINPTSTK